MAINRKSDRRRRLLVDTSQVQTDSNSPSTTGRDSDSNLQPSLEQRLYTVAAERRHQRKTTDLIPKRRYAVVATVACFMFAIIVLNLFAIYAPQWESVIGKAGVDALQIWGTGTLATWFASLCWIGAAAVCIQIFVLRRHRNDDYVGTYRVWGWLTLSCLFASALCTVDLMSILFHLFQWMTQVSLDEPVWLIPAILAMLVGMLVIRTLFEVRCSYGTVAWITLAWIAWSIAAVASMEQGSGDTAAATWFGVEVGLIYGNALLATAALVCLANLNYARYVFMRANGLVKPRVAVPAAEDQAALDAPQSRNETVAETTKPKRTPRKTKARAKAKPKADGASKVQVKTGNEVDNSSEKQVAPAKPKQIPLQVIGAEESPSTTNETKASNSSGSGSLSASEKLRQLAAASRAKQNVQQPEVSNVDAETESVSTSGKKLTKAEKRRLRKAQRKAKRAA